MLSYCSKQVIKLMRFKLQFISLSFFFFSAVFLFANNNRGDYSIRQKIQDSSYFLALDSLPNGWQVHWSLGQDSIERLKIVSPGKDVIVKVFAFKGNLDIIKFFNIDTLLFGSNFPRPFDTLYVKAYDNFVVRHKYVRRIESGLIIRTDIDFVWSEAKINYAYAIISDYINKTNPDIAVARSVIHLYPPNLASSGKKDSTPSVSDIFELLSILVATGSFVIAAIWGLSFIWEKIKYISKTKKFMILCFVIATGPIARYIFGLHRSSLIWVPLVSLFVIGLLIALGTGAFEISSSD